MELRADDPGSGFGAVSQVPRDAQAHHLRERTAGARPGRLWVVFFDIRVAATRDQPPTSNLPPTVGATSPTEGAAYINPASLTIAADATDSDGAVTRVDFLVDGTLLIETDSVAPWSAAWTSTATGSHTLTARAYDNAGGVTDSPAVHVMVQDPPSIPGDDVVVWASEAATTFNWAAAPDTSAAGGSPSAEPQRRPGKGVDGRRLAGQGPSR